jgi:predicted TIM-barrel fold metal-dependent hydrolase
MRLFDAHFHIDRGAEGYNLQPEGRNWIFNRIDQYKEWIDKVPAGDTQTLIFDFQKQQDWVVAEAASGRVQGLKIHSRLLGIQDHDYPDLFDAYSRVAHLKLPTVTDAFYIGHELDIQPNLQRIAEMVSLFPDNTFIIAHSGGIRVMDYFLHLKNCPNVVFELSLSLSYLKHSSVYADFGVLLRFADRNRIIFGTDFPYVDAQDQLKVFLKMADDLNMNETDREKILYTNAKKLFIGGSE